MQARPLPSTSPQSKRFEPTLDAATTGATLGVALWIAIAIVLTPLFSGRMPQWNAAGIRAAFPALATWMLFGFVAGTLQQPLRALASVFSRHRKREPQTTSAPARIVIVGGGFAGVTAAKALERLYAFNAAVEITLVSETNALLFTPMLAEVAGGSLEPTHISSPTRTALYRTNVQRRRVTGVDFDRRVVIAGEDELPYDQLVLALGSVSRYLGLASVERYSLDFKTLLDAVRVRNRVIEMFERADRVTATEERRMLLTFVVAGGGFAGAELAGALNDFARGIVVDYPRVCDEEVAVILIHSRERILPELSASLAHYALVRMQARGVTFRLKVRVRDATESSVTLDDGETIPAATLVWTAGTGPNPLLRALDLACDERGAAIVETTLAVKRHPGVWALGDCAAVTDGRTGEPCPPTAQFAIREAATVASNVRAAIDGREPADFHFKSLGTLCVVGYQTACAELRVPLRGDTVRFSGFFAWLLWRGIYLAKLPSAERKLRVLIDWGIELFFPPDIAATIDLKS